MTTESPKSQAAMALELIEAAFADRAPPTVMSDSRQLSDVEFDEVMSFEGMRWQDVAFDQIERNADAVFWFAPDAFCYYLPGFLAAGLREDSTDTNAYDSIIGCLDRSPEPDFWDDFFEPRWTLLTASELDAVEAWVGWLETRHPDWYFPNSYDRVRETLALLRERAQATE